MKKSLLLIFLAAIVLAGCASNKATFEQKQKCASYKAEIEKEIQDNDAINTLLYTLDEITYSPKIDSCIYSVYSDIDSKNYFIYDYFSKQTIYNGKTCMFDIDKVDRCSVDDEVNFTCMEGVCRQDYWNKMKELKGE